MVEPLPSKQAVASSNLVSRSNLFHVVLVSLRSLGLQQDAVQLKEDQRHVNVAIMIESGVILSISFVEARERLSEIPVVRKMNQGRRTFRVLGLPIQFVMVVVVSAALVIYLGAWAADSNIEARAEAFGAPTVQTAGGIVVPPSELSPDTVAWEGAFLWVCPLH